ncbi:energy transducer TonB [Pyxidicoccus fallax]|uniref:energy transducer TonB n=1 Tax=Pyxidicoccus fallax TaxID=394095 RepID=UPI0031B63E45
MALFVAVSLLCAHPARATTPGEGDSDDTSPVFEGFLCFPPMTPPKLLEGPPIEYTPEAIAAGAKGTLIAKCVITREGRIRDCEVIKGVEPMNDVVVKALQARRYTPVMFQGTPVEVKYTFTVRLTPAK